jgi:uncharacterized protein
MSSDVTGHLALPADGFVARWESGEHGHEVTLRWENEGWTAGGHAEAERVDYVVRLTAQWHVSQFLLFRDLDEADLWLGTDGHGRWGEVNGAHRPDLDGATDLAVRDSPFTHAIPIRRLPLPVGHTAEISVLHVDVDTLGVVPAPVRYERTADRRWRHEHEGVATEFEVDRYGLPLDIGDRFRRAG